MLYQGRKLRKVFFQQARIKNVHGGISNQIAQRVVQRRIGVDKSCCLQSLRHHPLAIDKQLRHFAGEPAYERDGNVKPHRTMQQPADPTGKVPTTRLRRMHFRRRSLSNRSQSDSLSSARTQAARPAKR